MPPPRPPTNPISRRLWFLHHPLVALTSALALAIAGFGLPHRNPRDLALAERLRAESIPDGGQSILLYLAHNDPLANFEFINTESDSGDRLARVSQDPTLRLIAARYDASRTLEGFWFPSTVTMHEASSLTLIAPQGAPFPASEQTAAWAAVIQWLRDPAGGNDLPAAAAVQATKGGVRTTRIAITYALILNAGSLAATLVLCFSLSRMPRYLRVARARRRLAHGRCGVCTYELQAVPTLNTAITCPECGSTWRPSELPVQPPLMDTR